MPTNIFPDNTMMNRGSYGGSDLPPELLPGHLSSSSTAQNNQQAGQQGAAAAQNNLQTGLSGATNAYESGLNQNLGFIDDRFNEASQPISGFVQNGQQAQNAQANLLGLNGQQAFDQSFVNDPGTRFLQDEQERALLRNSIATGGGVQGGRIRQQLQRDAFGRAQTNLNNQIQGLSNLAGQGIGAANSVGELGAREAGLGSNVIGGTTSGLAGARTQAGRDLASSVQSASNTLSDLQQQQGSGLADIGANQINDIRGQLTASETQRADLSTRLSTLLGNLAVGQGTNQAQIAQNVGLIEGSGILANTQLIGDSAESLIRLLGDRGVGIT